MVTSVPHNSETAVASKFQYFTGCRLHPVNIDPAQGLLTLKSGRVAACLLCRLVPAAVLGPAAGNVARYTLATTPIGGYQLSSGSTAGWLHYTPPYLLQTPITAVCLPYQHHTAGSM